MVKGYAESMPGEKAFKNRLFRLFPGRSDKNCQPEMTRFGRWTQMSRRAPPVNAAVRREGYCLAR